MIDERLEKKVENLSRAITETRSVMFGVEGSVGLVNEVAGLKERVAEHARIHEEMRDEWKRDGKELMAEHIEVHNKEGAEMAIIRAEKIKLTGVYAAVLITGIINIIVAIIAKFL